MDDFGLKVEPWAEAGIIKRKAEFVVKSDDEIKRGLMAGTFPSAANHADHHHFSADALLRGPCETETGFTLVLDRL